MHFNLLYTLFVVVDLGDLAIELLPVLLAPNIYRLLLLDGKIVVKLPCDLELEGERDVWCVSIFAGVFIRWLGVVVVVERRGSLLLLPTRENDVTEGGIPGVSAIGLDGCQPSLLVDVKLEFAAPGLCSV
jgi:hypothetical protein